MEEVTFIIFKMLFMLFPVVLLIGLPVGLISLIKDSIKKKHMPYTYAGNKKDAKLPSIIKTYDDMKDETQYRFNTNEIGGFLCLTPFITIQNGKCFLFVTVLISQVSSIKSDIGLNSILINCDGKRTTIPLVMAYGNSLTENYTSGYLSNNLYTSYSANTYYITECQVIYGDKKLLYDISQSKHTKIRFIGNKSYKDCIIGSFEKRCIYEMIKQYEIFSKQYKAVNGLI